MCVYFLKSPKDDDDAFYFSQQLKLEREPAVSIRGPGTSRKKGNVKKGKKGEKRRKKEENT